MIVEFGMKNCELGMPSTHTVDKNRERGREFLIPNSSFLLRRVVGWM